MLEKTFLASTLFYSMYVHKIDRVEQYLHAVDESFTPISAVNQKGNLKKRLKGKPVSAGFNRLT